MQNDEDALTEEQRMLLMLTENDVDLPNRMMLKAHLANSQSARDDYAAMHALRLLNAEQHIEQHQSAFNQRIRERVSHVEQSGAGGFLSALKRHLTRLLSWLGQASGPRWVLAAQSLAIVVLAVQLIKPVEEYSGFRGQAEAVCFPYLVQFKSDTQFGDIQRVLVQAGMKIGKGPNIDGEYELAAPSKSLEQVNSVLAEVSQTITLNPICAP